MEVLNIKTNRHTNDMLIVFLKSLIIFVAVVIAVRLMGKRTISEMQPFELVVTLIISEVACIPINDPYIPFYAGLIPIVTLTFLEVLVSFISRKSINVRRLVSGRAMLVIDKDGINYENLKKLNMNVHDLIETAHSSGYPDVSEIAYAIIETNGKMSVVEKTEEQPLLPLILVVDGKINESNVKKSQSTEADINKVLKQNGVALKDVLYADVRQDGTFYASPKNGGCFTSNLAVGGDW
ncbi:MAG: DUF421 domain-containing protein [Acutalibacteraceae bacterium]